MSVSNEHAKKVIRLGVGSGKNLAKCAKERMTWDEFGRRLGEPRRTEERFSDYQAMSEDRKAGLKRLAGWYIGGPVRGGLRKKANVVQRDVVTLDVDAATPELLKALEEGRSPIGTYEFRWHTTRSHSPGTPKLRIVLLAKGPIEPERYEAVTRVLAEKLDPTMKTVDPASFNVAQMMYWPTCSEDQEFRHGHNPGEPVDADAVLEAWGGDWRSFAALPRSPRETRTRPGAKKAEDPTRKTGVIGAFCRTYSIEEAIEEFLPGVFLPGDCSGGETRYTYAGASTSSGAVVYDDGKFLYSHHATDPGARRNLNAFDLVRVHRFETDAERAELEAEGAVTKLRSHKRMSEFAGNLDAVSRTMAAEAHDVTAMLDDISGEVEADAEEDLLAGTDAEEEEEEDVLGFELETELALLRPPLVRSRKREVEEVEDWVRNLLDLGSFGSIKTKFTNIATILLHAPQFRGALAYNEFADDVRIVRPVRPGSLPHVELRHVLDQANGDKLEDVHLHQIRAILEAGDCGEASGWDLSGVSDRDLWAAINLAARKLSFDPVKALMQRRWQRWDRRPGRLERLFVEVMGAEDTPYIRRAATLFVVASIARVYHPGHKWDHVPILMGRQGQGKSTFLAKLFGEELVGTLSADIAKGRNDAVEQMMGKLALELPEMAHLRRTGVDLLKTFVTETEDVVRLAYDRRARTYKRTSVFLASTNEAEFLRDETGNRRWWPIPVRLERMRFDWLDENRDQVWGEGMQVWWEMCQEHDYRRLPLFLDGEAAEEARARQSTHKEETQTEREAADIARWLEKPVPQSTFKGARSRQSSAFDEPLVLRTVTTTSEIGVSALGQSEEHARNSKSIAKAMVLVDGWSRASDRMTHPLFGRQRLWRREDASDEEIDRGYRIVASLDPDDEADEGAVVPGPWRRKGEADRGAGSEI